MKNLAFLILLLITYQINAAENLLDDDYIDNWHSTFSAIKDEKQILNIAQDKSVYFSREFNNSKQEYYVSPDNFSFIDDIVIIKIINKNNELIYKIVLSGWKIEETKAIYGTMYMYKDGNQYNGIPISYRSSKSLN